MNHWFKTLKQRVKQFAAHAYSATSSTEAVFTRIYQQHKWGEPKSHSDFDSGLGSAPSESLEKYISVVSNLTFQRGYNKSVFIDLGCGDFRVGRRLACLAKQYIGIDIVASLIDRNTKLFGCAGISFKHLNAITTTLPYGDVCFIRQVFQHLSNSQISRIIARLSQYKMVFITEHLPSDEDLIQPNLDKIHGADIRVYRHSGIYLQHPPFNVPREKLTLVLEVPGTDLGTGVSPGVIRTYLYEPATSFQ